MNKPILSKLSIFQDRSKERRRMRKLLFALALTCFFLGCESEEERAQTLQEKTTSEKEEDNFIYIEPARRLYIRNTSSIKSSDLSDLINVQELDISRISLESLPADLLSGLINLQTITIHSNNDLSDIPAGLFAGLINLQTITIHSNNDLSDIPAGLFSGLINLRVINLASNKFSNIPVGLFSGLINLQTIDLGFNDLSDIPAGLFSGLINLRTVDLAGNDLSDIPAGLFSDFRKLQKVDLSYNTLSTTEKNRIREEVQALPQSVEIFF